MNEVEVEAGAKLTTIAKSKQTGGDQNIWYIQVRMEGQHCAHRLRTTPNSP